jgi:LDH2 family malate/lactate/ureidoglycolate dehydrogenase
MDDYEQAGQLIQAVLDEEGVDEETAADAAEMHVTNCRIASNATGILQSAGGTVRIANSDVVFNTANGTSGTVNSYGNNRFAGNAGSSAVVAVGADTHDEGQQ